MRNKTVLFSSILLASGSVLAGPSVFENAVKKAAKDSETAVASEAVEKSEAAGQTLENAGKLKEGVESAPEALRSQAQEGVKQSVEQQIDAATPEEAKNAVEAAKELKENVESVPKTTEEIEGKAQEKASGKILELLH